jgi:hypothetical protein
MLDIPASFIISSRLSVLGSKEISSIIQLAQTRWKESQIQQRIKQRKMILGVGISNPQELATVIEHDIPIIHIQHDCKSLQAVQKRRVKQQKWMHRVQFLLSSSSWGLFGYCIQKLNLKRGLDTMELDVFEKGKLPIPNYIIGIGTLTISVFLGYFTKRLLYNKIRKNEYEYIDKQDEFILLRNDVLYSQFRYILQTVIPYCFIGLSVYHLKQK